MTLLRKDVLDKYERDISYDDVRVNIDAEVFGEDLISTRDYRNRLFNDLIECILSIENAANKNKR